MVGQVKDDLREQLAEYAHDAWSGWMRYMLPKICRKDDGPRACTDTLLQRWFDEARREMSTPYADLPESEKESDRDEADKMLAIVAGRLEMLEVQLTTMGKPGAARLAAELIAEMKGE